MRSSSESECVRWLRVTERSVTWKRSRQSLPGHCTQALTQTRSFDVVSSSHHSRCRVPTQVLNVVGLRTLPHSSSEDTRASAMSTVIDVSGKLGEYMLKGWVRLRHTIDSNHSKWTEWLDGGRS